MVLEDIDPASNGFNDTPYPSEDDPYANSTSSSRPRYDLDTLPHPLPILGPLVGFTEKRVRFGIDATLKFAEYRVRRPLTPDEAQALASHLGTFEQTKSYFAATGFALGTWRWYSTINQNRYPFYLPKPESVNPNKFVFVNGPAAFYARHSWRFLLYYVVASRLGSLVGQVLAQPIAAQDTAKDPRLAQFSKDLQAIGIAEGNKNGGWKEMVQYEMDKKVREQRASAVQEKWANRAGGGDTRSPRSWSNQKSSAVDDDMSPTAGNDPWSPAVSDTWADTDRSTESTTYPQARDQAPEGTSWGRPTTRPTGDDASPTGGFSPAEDTSTSKPGESAWERLRRGATPPPTQQRSTADNQSSPQGQGDDSFFSGSDDSRSQTREQAQRDFDARIERERQAKDFSEGRRW